MDATPEDAEQGHSFYTKRTLAVYDVLILWYFCRFAWRCPSPRILEHYNEHVSSNHLDIGVGTGYFLDKCRFPSDSTRLALMDINANCLDVAARRTARYNPESYIANVLEPIAIEAPKFDSVGMNYLLHCLPGTIRTKAIVFENVKALVNPGGVIFGATLLHDGVKRNLFARKVMARNNKTGTFTNTHDDLEGLESVVSRHLNDAKVEVVGCMGLFSGRA